MIILDIVCLVVGGVLFAYCAGGLSDEFWSRRTQRLHWVGLVFGAAGLVGSAVLLIVYLA